MKTFIRIRSEYFEHDSSKYRLGVTQQTLIPSLKNQTSKDFIILLEMSAMDPYYSKRRLAFDSVGVDVWPFLTPQSLESPRIEISIGDDDFISAAVVRLIQDVPEQAENTRFIFPNGFTFHDGQLSVCMGVEDVIDAAQIVSRSNSTVTSKSMVLSAAQMWIHVRHGMNATVSDPPAGLPVRNLSWPGWKANMVERYCAVKIAEATAQGCEFYPTKSKSVCFAVGSARQRRKK